MESTCLTPLNAVNKGQQRRATYTKVCDKRKRPIRGLWEQPLPPLVAKETNYFKQHREQFHYETRTAIGCLVGSGAMESLCGQLQGRFKREAV